MLIRRFKFLWIITATLLLAACGEPDKPVTKKSSAQQPVKSMVKSVVFQRNNDIAKIVRGGQIFKQNCASCHGDNAQGANNWQKRDAKGKFLPPPLDGTGHAWHHPMAGLKQTIFFGTEKIGGSMPGWQGKLTGAQVDDILAWVQAKWPDELYQAWANNNARSLQK